MATVFNDNTADHKWSTAGNWSAGKPDSSDAVTIGSSVTALEIDEAATCLSFDATGPSSAITISGSGTLAVASSFVLDTGVTWSGTGAITISVDYPPTLTFAGRSLPVVNLTVTPTVSRTYALSCSGATFGQLNLTHNADRSDTYFTFDGNFTIGDSSTWIGGGAGNDWPFYRPLISSSAPGTARTITVSGASKTLTFTDVDLRDITISTSNSPTIAGTRVGDCGGNTNCDCETPKTVYAVCGTAHKSWYNDIWSLSSGGETSLNNVPLAQDTAIVDNSTFSATHKYLYLAGGRTGGIDSRDFTESAKNEFRSYAATTIYGSFYRGTTISTWNISHVPVFDARVASTLVLSNLDVSVGCTILSYGGTVQLATANTFAGTVTVTQGTLDLNGQTFTCGVLSSSNSNTRTIQDSAGGGKIVLNGLTGTILDFSTSTNLTFSNSPDIDIGDSNNTLTANVTFAGGGQTFGDFSVKKHAGDYDCIITGANDFGAVTLETPDATYQYSDIQFTNGTDTDITSLSATGTSSYTINIKSTSAGAAATLSDTTGTNTVSYCTIQDMTVEGGATWAADDGTNTDVSGNTGWTWPAAGGVPINDLFIRPFAGPFGRVL